MRLTCFNARPGGYSTKRALARRLASRTEQKVAIRLVAARISGDLPIVLVLIADLAWLFVARLFVAYEYWRLKRFEVDLVILMSAQLVICKCFRTISWRSPERADCSSRSIRVAEFTCCALTCRQRIESYCIQPRECRLPQTAVHSNRN
jgi:hypothetical protein